MQLSESIDVLIRPKDETRQTSSPAPAKPASDIRIPALDGLRGLMTIFVVISHYFGEVPAGLTYFCVGWMAVMVFFVLSGYLVGRLIIEKMSSSNFLPVFYLRRVCRTFPTYFVATTLILMLVGHFSETKWIDAEHSFPTWAYFVFAQNFLLNMTESYGAHWLAPTWTLALEEQFYLVAPALLIFTPKRHWLKILIAISLAGLAFRAHGVLSGNLVTAPIAILPSAADVLLAGVILAVLVTTNAVNWTKYSTPIRVLPIICLVLTSITQRLDHNEVGPWFEILGPFFTAIGGAAFILMLIKGAPEAKRFESKILKFFGNISYSVYLTHLAVLGLLHGLIFGKTPDIASLSQIGVTIAAIPLTVAIAWLMTRTLEEPITQWGRGHKWN